MRGIFKNIFSIGDDRKFVRIYFFTCLKGLGWGRTSMTTLFSLVSVANFFSKGDVAFFTPSGQTRTRTCKYFTIFST